MKRKSKIYQDVIFITIKDNKEINNIKILKEYPLPVQLTDKEISPEKGITSEAIIAGLIIVVAEGVEQLKNVDTLNKVNLEEAFSYYKELLLFLQPDAIKTLSLAGIARSNAEDFEFATQLFSAVINLSHTDTSYINLATMYAKQASKYQKENNLKISEIADDNLFSTLHEGLEYNPSSISLKAELGAYHLRHKDLDISYDYFNSFLENAPEGKQRSEIQKIVSDLKEILDDDNAIVSAYDQIMLENFDKAISILDNFQKNNPDAWEGWFLRGWALRCQQKFEEAKKSLLTSIEKDFGRSEIYNELSLCCKALEENELAKEYLNIANELDEENVIYLANLSFLYLADKEFDKAKYYLEKARVLDENDPQVKALIEEYEGLTGEKLGEIIKEEFVDNSTIEEFLETSKENGNTLREI
ncbi:MAG: hypothetical protein WC162_00940 [Sphaerochaetaceae bacterium]|nr:hypothetical protein [Sphaerochaetaceae bacterium]